VQYYTRFTLESDKKALLANNLARFVEKPVLANFFGPPCISIDCGSWTRA